MIRNSALLIALSLSVAAFAQTTPDMLQRVMPGVLTIAVNETSPVKNAMGAASGSTRFDKAYDRVLDLSDAKGSGSGFVVKYGDRYFVVTNAHVVEMAQPDQIYGYSINQTRYRLKVFGGDSFYDVALLEFADPVQPGPEMTALTFRPDDPRIGETVYALGNPLGAYPYSVTQGIVGGKNRLLGGLTGRIGYLQHSASIIWGNSGGPLIDSTGRVVGINTRIEIADRGQEFLISQLNFALETSVAQRVIEGLLHNNGRLRRAYLGLVLTQTLPVNKFRKSVATAAIIESVVPGGPAAPLARFQSYRVDRIGRTPVRNLDEAMEAIEAIKPGERVEFELTKDSNTETVTVVAGELSAANYAALANHIISSHSDYSLSEQNGHIILQRQGQPTGERTSAGMTMRGIGAEKTSVQTTGGTPDVLGIVAVGLVPQRRNDNDDADPVLYRVNTIRDLGVAMRLFFMGGGADFVVVPPNSDQPGVLRWSLSGNSNALTRMLIS
jgi:S1-C subfamily serine protease